MLLYPTLQLTLVTQIIVTLQLLPGHHNLDVVLSVQTINYFSIISMDNFMKPTVNCKLPMSLNIKFNSITHVLIDGVIFLGCVQTKIHAVDNFTILRSNLSGIKETVTLVPGTALMVSESTVRIKNSMFRNFDGSRSLAALPQRDHSGHDHDIAGPGVILCSESSIEIINSSFVNNSGRSGGAVLAELSRVVIVSSSFFNNTLSTCRRECYGGVLYSDRSNVTTLSCIFDSNGGNNVVGGVFRTLQSCIRISECKMVNNTATTCDVLRSDNSNVTINNTTFSNNKAKYVGGVLCTGSSSTFINKASSTIMKVDVQLCMLIKCLLFSLRIAVFFKIKQTKD